MFSHTYISKHYKQHYPNFSYKPTQKVCFSLSEIRMLMVRFLAFPSSLLLFEQKPNKTTCPYVLNILINNLIHTDTLIKIKIRTKR